MLIHLFAPFFTGSHRRWAEEYRAASQHEVQCFTLPGRHWKWRMHGAAVTLATQWLAQDRTPDLILTTDMLDTATFLALTRKRSAAIPTAIYFHENQLAYPWSPTDRDVSLRRDRHYAWINYTSALAADALFFNSPYNKDSFLELLPGYLKAFPDFTGAELVERLTAKSQVLPLGLRFGEPPTALQPDDGPPVLLWNHRWEYDKNPEAFFALCYRLQTAGIAFRLIVLGEHFAQSPAVFAEAKDRLQDHILHWGFAADRTTYERLLGRADILPVTSRQDFFGGSAVEAMHANVYPLLPNRLAFQMHIPAVHHDRHLYGTEEELYQKTRDLLRDPAQLAEVNCSQWVARYDWQVLAPQYDLILKKSADA